MHWTGPAWDLLLFICTHLTEAEGKEKKSCCSPGSKSLMVLFGRNRHLLGILRKGSCGFEWVFECVHQLTLKRWHSGRCESPTHTARGRMLIMGVLSTFLTLSCSSSHTLTHICSSPITKGGNIYNGWTGCFQFCFFSLWNLKKKMGMCLFFQEVNFASSDEAENNADLATARLGACWGMKEDCHFSWFSTASPSMSLSFSLFGC